jgi:hypothetical protein
VTELEKRALTELVNHPALVPEERNVVWGILLMPDDYVLTLEDEAAVSRIRKRVRDDTPSME